MDTVTIPSYIAQFLDIEIPQDEYMYNVLEDGSEEDTNDDTTD